MVGISADPAEDSAEFIQDEGITVPLLADPDLAVVKSYGVAMDGRDIAVPSTYVIRQDKSIHWRYVGENMSDRPENKTLLEIAIEAKQ